MKGFEFLMGKPPPDEKPKETHVEFLARAIKELEMWIEKPETRPRRHADKHLDTPKKSPGETEEETQQLRQTLQEYRDALAGIKGCLESELERLKKELEEIQEALLANNRQQTELERAPAQDGSEKKKLRALEKNADTLKSSALRKNMEIIACQKELSELTDTGNEK